MALVALGVAAFFLHRHHDLRALLCPEESRGKSEGNRGKASAGGDLSPIDSRDGYSADSSSSSGSVDDLTGFSVDDVPGSRTLVNSIIGSAVTNGCDTGNSVGNTSGTLGADFTDFGTSVKGDSGTSVTNVAATKHTDVGNTISNDDGQDNCNAFSSNNSDGLN